MSVPSQRNRRRGKKAMECKHTWRVEGGKEGRKDSLKKREREREREREEYVSSSAKGAMAEKGRREACKR
jgi:hypothetical protein